MRAATLTSFSGPEALAIADITPPAVGPNDVLVLVEAAAIGPWDLRTARGEFAAFTRQIPLPQVLGWDFAGTVGAIGSAVTRFALGDQVFGFSPQLFTGAGAFAEQVAVTEALLAPRPPELSPSRAATVPVCGLTAHQLIDKADLRPGDRVLILGAAGAVGGFAAQLALQAKAHVSGTASIGDLELLESRGIRGIDRRTDLATLDEEFDVVLDLVGSRVSLPAIPLLRAGGRLVSAVPDDVPRPTRGDVQIGAIGVQPDPAALAALGAAAARGAMPLPRITAELPLDQAQAAFADLASGAVKGKVVLLPGPHP